MDYRKKIEDIAARDGITVGYDAPNLFESYSQPLISYLGLAPWSDDPETAHKQYWIALHEIGHVHTTDFPIPPEWMVMAGQGNLLVDAEAEAWEWALQEAGQLDDTGRLVIDAAMGAYTADLGPGGEPVKKLARKVTGSDAFAFHQRAEVESLLA